MKKDNQFVLSYIAIITLSFLLSIDLINLYQESFAQNNDEINKENNSITTTTTNLSNTDIINTNNFLSYEDKDIGFKIQYPSEWEIKNEDSSFYTVATFQPIDKDIQVNVRILPQGDYKSVKKYGDAEFKESNEYTLLAYYRNGTTTLGGLPAFKEIYLTTYNPSMFENALGYSSSTSRGLMTASLVEPKKSFFAIVYFAPPKLFSQYYPIVEKMIQSFQIKQTGPIIQEED